MKKNLELSVVSCYTTNKVSSQKRLYERAEE